VIIATSLKYGTKLLYAAAHQFGATIRARNAQYLTLPFPGVRRSARDYENTFVRKSRAGNLIIFQKTGEGIKPLFLLKKKVKLPSRPFVMFQTEDVNMISAYALAFHFDPAGSTRLAASMKGAA
jgi:phage gpG-like protein